jgi:hypothetical protein
MKAVSKCFLVPMGDSASAESDYIFPVAHFFEKKFTFVSIMGKTEHSPLWYFASR